MPNLIFFGIHASQQSYQAEIWAKARLWASIVASRVGVNGSFSDWTGIASGVPQGSVLGPLLFILYVNDLPQWITNHMRIFADDTKIWAKISSEKDSCSLQTDLDKLNDWSNRWLLTLNAAKCNVMHVGHDYATKYYIEEGQSLQELATTTVEKDLGIYTRNDLKPARQCTAAAAKASSVLGIIRRNFRTLNIENFKLLYKTYIRPHLEYCIQAWSPHLAKDIACLESVQRRATQIVAGFRNKPYEERLKLLGLTTLERRRTRGDLIETFKILTGRESVDRELFFTKSQKGRNMRGHSLKLFKPRCNTTLRQNSFSMRIIDDWNKLPQHVIDATSVNAFKNALDKHWNNDMGT